jgi:glycosyltransferase involved in cell wall biosynthesis
VAFARRTPLRVLHVTAVETTNYYLNNLARFISREDVQLLAATLGRPGTFISDLESIGVRAWTLNAVSRRSYPLAVVRLWRLVHREGADILHLHLFEPTVLGLLVAALSRRPAIVTRHHSDAVHRLPAGIRKRVYSCLERWINRNASHIIAPSQRVYEILTRDEGVNEAKVSLIPYGQTRERFDAVREIDPIGLRRALGVASPLLVCVSRLHAEKGHRFLLDAFARLRSQNLEAILWLVGAGPEREALAVLVDVLELGPAVRFLGWRDDVLRLMWAADLIVHPSLHEALPSVVIEAIMLGLPVVATDVSGVRDVLGDSKYGAVVPPGDANVLHLAMRAALVDLPGARRRAEEGRIHVSTYMDAGRVAREYAACYRAVAKQCPGK